MSDQTINQFVAQFADATARAAFVPNPPTPAADGDNGYFAFQQDDSSIWCWDSNGSAWVQVGNGSGVNTVSAAGTLTSGEPVLGAGTKAVAVGPINLAGGATFVTGDLPYANLAQGTALSVLGVTGNSTADNASIVAGSDHQVLRRSGTAVAFGQVNVGQSAAITGVLPVANGGTGSASGAGILKATVPITNAELLALQTTPKELVASPGAGFRLALLCVWLQVDTIAANYNTIDADAYLVLQMGTGDFSNYIANDAGAGYTQVTSLLTGASLHSVQLTPNLSIADPNWGVLPMIYGGAFDNLALRLFAFNGGVDFGGGNAGNNAIATVYYAIESTIT